MKNVKHVVGFLVLFFYSNSFICAQDTTAIRAKIVDTKTGMPVPFATVKVMKGKTLIGGVISNGDGDFQVPSRYRSGIDSISVAITCIGYSNLVIKLNQLSKDRINILKLKVTSLRLKEVVITPEKQIKFTANKIVRLAIQNMPKNYPIHPFSYLAYYRDYQKEENEYVNLNEAIVGVFDKGFKANDYVSTGIKLYQFRTNKDFRRDSMAALAYDNNNFGGNKFIPTATVFSFGGNELSILRIHDALRNNKTTSFSFVNEFGNDFVKNHAFKLLETVYLDDVPLYHISFQSFYFVTKGQHVAKGEIFIEHGTYAIHKLIYSTYLKESGKESLLYTVQIEYARKDSLMFLNYISFNNFFKSNTNDGFKVNDVVYDRAMNAFVITFNHTPQDKTVIAKKNYDFKFDKRPLLINEIALSKNNNKEVHVFIGNTRDFNLREKPAALMKKFEASFKNIKDSAGNEINEIKYKTVNQFRELFMQKLSPSTAQPANGLFIAKDTPLKQNRIDPEGLKNASTFWMNTPLKNNSDWVKENQADSVVADSTFKKIAINQLPQDFNLKSTPSSAAEANLPGHSNITFMEEKAYVQTDKSYYYPGEKLWFKAYMNYRTTTLKDSLSRVLYVELINPVGKIEQSRTLRIDKGAAYGDFSLSASTTPGKYFLRAYTNWMLNYGDENIFVKPIRVFNLFEQPERNPKDTARGPIYGGLALSPSKTSYNPREEVKLEMQLKDESGNPLGGNFSVSVTDMGQVTPVGEEKNIIKDYPFDKMKESIKVDSLLSPIEFGISAQGIYKDKKAKTPNTKLMVIQTRKKKLEDFVSVDMDINGKFWVSGFQFYDSADVGFKVSGSRRQVGKIELLPREIPSTLNLKSDLIFKTKTESTNQRPELNRELTGDAILLKEVVIEAKKYKEKPVDPFYGMADYSIPEDVISRYNSILPALQGRVPGLQVFGNEIRLGMSSLLGGGSSDPLVIIDGIRVGGGSTGSGVSAGDALNAINPFLVERIDVFKFGGAAIYGTAGGNGVIIVHTKKSYYETKQEIPGVIDQDSFQIFKMAGYSPPTIFKLPDYSVKENSSQPDYRSTILWQPQVELSENEGKATLLFYTADFPTRYRIVVEGVTSTFKPVRNVIFIEVGK